MYASRILRYHEKVLKSQEFRDGIGYIGVLFQAVKMLNHKVKLIPMVNELIDSVDYRKERYFDMELLISIIDSIDSVSEITENNFDDIYSIVYLTSCKRKIKVRQKKIR